MKLIRIVLKVVFILAVLGLLAQIALSVRRVMIDQREGEMLVQRAKSLHEAVARNRIPPPPRDPAQVSGAALAPWQTVPAPPTFPPATFQEGTIEPAPRPRK